MFFSSYPEPEKWSADFQCTWGPANDQVPLLIIDDSQIKLTCSARKEESNQSDLSDT